MAYVDINIKITDDLTGRELAEAIYAVCPRDKRTGEIDEDTQMLIWKVCEDLILRYHAWRMWGGLNGTFYVECMPLKELVFHDLDPNSTKGSGYWLIKPSMDKPLIQQAIYYSSRFKDFGYIFGDDRDCAKMFTDMVECLNHDLKKDWQIKHGKHSRQIYGTQLDYIVWPQDKKDLTDI